MIGHILSFLAGGVVFSLILVAVVIVWAVRGSKWLVSGK